MSLKIPDQAQESIRETSVNCPDLPPRRLYTLKAFAERHKSFLTLPGLTNQVFKAKPRESTKGTIPGNGMVEAGAIIRLAGRVLIDEDGYFRWIDSLQKGAVFRAQFGFASPLFLWLLLIAVVILLVAAATGEQIFNPQEALCLMLGGLKEASKSKPKKLRPPYRFSINLPTLIADTYHLAPLAFGCLMRLLMHYWHHGPLKDRDSTLARIVGLPSKEWASVRPEIESQFDIAAGQWLHSGLDQALEDAYAAIAANKERTAKATSARLAKRAATKKATAECDVERHVQRDEVRDGVLNGSIPEAPLSPAKGVEFSPCDFADDIVAAERRFGTAGDTK